MSDSILRCGWCGTDSLYCEYHDHVWGRPVSDERDLFAKLCLDGQQAGLSWITILKKQQNYYEAFDQFNPEKIARYSDKKLQALLQNPGIIRNKLKVESIRRNARAFLKVQEEGSFAHYLWRYVDGQPIQNQFQTLAEVPANTALSDELSKQLKKDGFNFVGSTIVYAFMQAVGMVNDHITACHCYEEVKQLGANFRLT